MTLTNLFPAHSRQSFQNTLSRAEHALDKPINRPPIIKQQVWIAPRSIVERPTVRFLVQDRERLMLDRNAKVNGLLAVLSLGLALPLAHCGSWLNALPFLAVPGILGAQAVDQFGKLSEIERTLKADDYRSFARDEEEI